MNNPCFLFPFKVTIARENKFCSYEEVVKQIQQANRIIRKKLGADDGSGSDDHAQGGEPCAETWSILLTCPVTLTRMQVAILLADWDVVFLCLF